MACQNGFSMAIIPHLQKISIYIFCWVSLENLFWTHYLLITFTIQKQNDIQVWNCKYRNMYVHTILELEWINVSKYIPLYTQIADGLL